MVAAAIRRSAIRHAALSPVGRDARLWGRRPLLLFGFRRWPCGGCLLADRRTGPAGDVSGFRWRVRGGSRRSHAADILDLTRETGHFNLALAWRDARWASAPP